MPSQVITAWIFDVYPTREGVAVWLIDREGRKYACEYGFVPSFYLQLNGAPVENGLRPISREITARGVTDPSLQKLEFAARRCPVRVSLKTTERMELFSGKWQEVVQVFVHNPLRFREAVRHFEKFFPHYSFFNSDILPEQLFLYETGLFPLGYGEFEVRSSKFEVGGWKFMDDRRQVTDLSLQSWKLRDSRDAVEYEIPPFAVMRLRTSNDFVPAKYQRSLPLEISYEGKIYALETQDPVELLEEINRHLKDYDPDIILTEYGDSILLPKLTALAAKYKIPLMFNRDIDAGYKQSRESSFFQYGKVVHKDGAFQLRGRWHIDVCNSFTIVESDMEGLYEIIRVTQLCPQHQARASIGTGLSSLQLSWAYRNKVLIPSKKREPEDFKPASTLLMSDRGGLIYMPPIGYFENVAELDFVSMYPNIMVNHNISPETVNCECCKSLPNPSPKGRGEDGQQRFPEEIFPPSARGVRNGSRNSIFPPLRGGQEGLGLVPELGYHICQKRVGIVPATLRSVVAKRAYYKQKRKEFKGKDERKYNVYDSRQNALKWMLVSCFGYLGYKNARFGRIEAHESVNAFSREAILTAKEIAEENGFELVHAIIDCMWLRRAAGSGAKAPNANGTVNPDLKVGAIRKQGGKPPCSNNDGKALQPTEADYLKLCEEIKQKVGVDISLEGIYKWILFPASKMDSQITTGNRYAGTYTTGEIKIRGLEIRRHDMPKIVKKMQKEMLDRMAEMETVEEIRGMVGNVEKSKGRKVESETQAKDLRLCENKNGDRLLSIVEKYVTLVLSGQADVLDLVVRRHTNKEANEYLNNSISAGVTKMLEKSGMRVAAGEAIEYIIINQSKKFSSRYKSEDIKAKPLSLYAIEDGYDIPKYTELLLKAAETILLPLGYDYEKLREMFLKNNPPYPLC
jgi:DNA polymerase-2